VAAPPQSTMLYTAAARQLSLSRSVCALSCLALWLAHGADAVPVSLHYNTSNTGLGSRDNRWVKLLGRAPSLEACSQLCLAHASSAGERCRSFSRYTAQYAKNSSEVGNCYGHVDPAWLPLPVGDGSIDSGLVQWPCEDDAGCSLNGKCVEGNTAGSTACHCSTGWHGDRCELLKLAPVDRHVLGFNPNDALNGGNMSSWGGSIQQVDGVWHMWASRFDNHCGVSTYLLNSRVVHAVSTTDSVLGPYKEKESVVPPFAHEPDVVRAPTGELVMISVHGDLSMLKNGSRTGPYKPCECTVAGVPTGPCPGGCNSCHIQSPTLTVASTPEGPWNTTPIWPGGGENPSIWITKDGALWGMSRGGHMSAYAADWANISGWTHTIPESNATNSFMSSSPDAEDPYLYQDENDNWHALLHSLEGPHMVGGVKGALVGTHAFSTDGLGWMYTGVAYTNEVNLTDGTALQLNRRERPHLVFAEGTRTPVALTNSAEAGKGSFTLVQAITP
jgi:hypothetical protein